MKLLSILSLKKNSPDAQRLFEQIDHLLDSARQLFTQSENLKRVVASEKNSVQQSSAAAHEISSMVATTADAAAELSQMAVDSNRAVAGSVESMRKLVELIDVVDKSSNHLQETVRSGLTEIGSVTSTMAEIREKAKMINDVVFQTKLLSFNASVEAARAGEHGKGFAVVAEEMGKLARTSGQAAQEIETILNAGVERTRAQIEEVTRNLETVAKSTIEAIGQVSSRSKEISGSFAQLEGYAKNTETKAQQISAATSEQKIGVQEISKSLQDLGASSLELDSMAAESNRNSAQLAESVEKITSQFIVLAAKLGVELVKVEKPFDFSAAISAHIDWKMKLTKYLENPNGSLDHAKVCKDNACALGKWIYGDGQQFSPVNPGLFDSVKDHHAQFHRIAGKIVELINGRRLDEASKLLGAGGPYLRISQETVALIQELQRAVETDPGRKAA